MSAWPHLLDTALWTDQCRHDMLVRCATIHAESQGHPEMQYQAALVYDQLLMLRASLPGHAGDGMPLAEDLLPELHQEVLNAAWWLSMRLTASEASLLISKALPQRCQKRNFSKRVAQFLEAKNIAIQALFAPLIAASLLGTYRHVAAAARPAIHASDATKQALRTRILALARPPPGLTEEIRALLTRHPLLLTFVAREYLVYALRDDPVLRRNCALMFDVGAFSQLTVQCMDRVRALVARPDPWRALLEGVGDIIKQAHKSFLGVCYQRQRPPFIMEIQSPKLTAFSLPKVGTEASQALTQLVARIPFSTPDTVATKLIIESLVSLGGCPEAQEALRKLHAEFDLSRKGKRQFRSEVENMARTSPLTLSLFRLGARLWELHAYTQVVDLPQHFREGQARAVASSLRLNANGVSYVPSEMVCVAFCDVCGHIYSVMNRSVTPIKNSFRFGLRSARVDIMGDERVAYCTADRSLGHMHCRDRPLRQVSLLGRMLLFHRELLFLCSATGCGMIAKLDTARCAYTSQGFFCHKCTNQRRARWLLEYVESGFGCALPRQKRVVRKKGEPRPIVDQQGVVCALCPTRTARISRHAVERLHDLCKAYGESTDGANLDVHFPVLEQNESTQLRVYPAGVLLCPKHHSTDLAELVAARASPFSPRAEVIELIMAWHQARKAYYQELYRKRDRAVLASMRSEGRGHRPGRFIYHHSQ